MSSSSAALQVKVRRTGSSIPMKACKQANIVLVVAPLRFVVTMTCTLNMIHDHKSNRCMSDCSIQTSGLALSLSSSAQGLLATCSPRPPSAHTPQMHPLSDISAGSLPFLGSHSHKACGLVLSVHIQQLHTTATSLTKVTQWDQAVCTHGHSSSDREPA